MNVKYQRLLNIGLKIYSDAEVRKEVWLLP